MDYMFNTYLDAIKIYMNKIRYLNLTICPHWHLGHIPNTYGIGRVALERWILIMKNKFASKIKSLMDK